ncbi:MAG: PspC domain-containing protein [Candidatus Limnocylindrales bacterium]
MNPHRLYRSRDRQLAGVAAGMAEYFGIDPTIVRILWILSMFVGGFSILLYIILAFVMPEAPVGGPSYGAGSGGPAAGGPAGPGTGPQGASWYAGQAPAWSPDWAANAAAEARTRERSTGRGPGAAVIVGVTLIVFGAIALADNVLPGWVGAALFGPGLIIALGAALLVGSLRRQEHVGPAAPAPSPAATFETAATPFVTTDVPAPPAAPTTWESTSTETVGPFGRTGDAPQPSPDAQ